MKVLAIVMTVVGCALAAPAKLDGLEHHHHEDPLAAAVAAQSRTFEGYNYEPPAQPSGLYELPDSPSINVVVTEPPTTTTTTTTTTTPPPPPPSAYLPPVDEIPSGNNPVPEVIEVGGTTMMPMPYNIRWGVADEESGNVFNHVEDSDGKDVTGEYSVLLPDGRMQIVRFTVDPVNGYQAEVSYEPAK